MVLLLGAGGGSVSTSLGVRGGLRGLAVAQGRGQRGRPGGEWLGGQCSAHVLGVLATGRTQSRAPEP